MQKRLVPASYIQTKNYSDHSTHSIASTIETKSGLELTIAAISHKKDEASAKGETPRMALSAFLASLQNSTDDTIPQVILGAISQTTKAIYNYVSRRRGVSCSLTAAIIHDDQLFGLQMGTGEILVSENQKLASQSMLSDRALDIEEVWLGEAEEVNLNQINFYQISEDKISSNTAIFVCQQELAHKIMSAQDQFFQTYNSIILTHPLDDLPLKLAEWAKGEGVDSHLTLATIHPANPNNQSLVDFFSLNEALLGQSTTNLNTVKLSQDTASPLLPLQQLEASKNEISLKMAISAPTRQPVVFTPVSAEDEHVVFSSAATIPSQSLNVAKAAPILPKIAPGALAKPNPKLDQISSTAETQVSIPTIQHNSAIFLKQLVRSYIWPIIAALCTILFLLVSYQFFASRSSAEPDAQHVDEAVQEVSASDEFTHGDDESISTVVETPNAVAIVPSPTSTPTNTPTQTQSPTKTFTPTVSPTTPSTLTPEPTQNPAVGLFLQAQSSESEIVELGDTVISSRLSRIVFDKTSTNDAGKIDEVYALPGSVLTFSQAESRQTFEIEQGSALIFNAQLKNIVSILPAVDWELENRDGCMSVDYSRADRPVILACYAGECSWTNENGDKYNLPTGSRIELMIESQNGDELIEPSRIIGREAQSFYQSLLADPNGADLANSCLAEFLPPPVTITPTPLPTETAAPTQPPSNSGSSNKPAPTSTPSPPTSTPLPPPEPTIEPIPTKEQLPERPIVTPDSQPATAEPDPTEDNTGFPATSTPAP